MQIVYTVLCNSFCTNCCIFSAQIALQLSDVFSLTNFNHKFIALQIFTTSLWSYKFLFKYIIFLNIIHEEKGFIMQLIWKVFSKEI